jgi:hypothetical protein
VGIIAVARVGSLVEEISVVGVCSSCGVVGRAGSDDWAIGWVKGGEEQCSHGSGSNVERYLGGGQADLGVDGRIIERYLQSSTCELWSAAFGGFKAHDQDGPYPQDGTITKCPAFKPLNASSPSLLLSRPFPAVSASVATFDYTLWKNGSALQMLPEFTFIARGLGSSGTVEIVGTEAPAQVLADGKEGVMRVEVIALYSGQQDLEDVVRVCELSRGIEGIGLGVFVSVYVLHS